MSCLITTEFAAYKGRTRGLQKFLRLTKKGWNAYNLHTNSPSFWPIYLRRSTDIPPTINGQHIGRVSAANYRPRYLPIVGRYVDHHSADISVELCRPTHLGRHIDWHSTDMSTDISADTQPLCWLIHRSSVGRYVDRYISVEGCTKYTWSV